MNKVLLFIFLSIGVSSFAKSDEYSSCKNKWGNDYRQQEYCVKKEKEAHNNIDNWNGNYSIVESCRNQWTKNYETDFRQTYYCSKKEQEALNTLNNWSGDFEVLEKCKEQWVNKNIPNYRQAVYCSKKEQEAKNRLNNI